jgi:hypothetical protein
VGDISSKDTALVRQSASASGHRGAKRHPTCGAYGSGNVPGMGFGLRRPPSFGACRAMQAISARV